MKTQKNQARKSSGKQVPLTITCANGDVVEVASISEQHWQKLKRITQRARVSISEYVLGAYSLHAAGVPAKKAAANGARWIARAGKVAAA